MHTNEAKYTKEDIDDINGPPEHMWDNIAPSTEEHTCRLHSIAEGSKQVSQQDLQTYYLSLAYMSDLKVLQ